MPVVAAPTASKALPTKDVPLPLNASADDARQSVPAAVTVGPTLANQGFSKAR